MLANPLSMRSPWEPECCTLVDRRMDDYLDTNRQLWDAWVKAHVDSDFYDVAAFKAGATSLQAVEREELTDVRGKTLLHLQCHFGMDTLSWAREGALVTGVDFSPDAIRLARALAEETGLAAAFIESDVYGLPEKLNAQFDIVFTSYGVLIWLPDLDHWAQVVAHFLKPGGTFYIVEFHPILEVFDEPEGDLRRSYFPTPEPTLWHSDGSYGAPNAEISLASYQWAHPLGEVVTALVQAGLRIEYLHEFPYSLFDCFPYLEEHAPGRYGLKGRPNTIPLVFSLRATR